MKKWTSMLLAAALALTMMSCALAETGWQIGEKLLALLAVEQRREPARFVFEGGTNHTCRPGPPAPAPCRCGAPPPSHRTASGCSVSDLPSPWPTPWWRKRSAGKWNNVFCQNPA